MNKTNHNFPFWVVYVKMKKLGNNPRFKARVFTLCLYSFIKYSDKNKILNRRFTMWYTIKFFIKQSIWIILYSSILILFLFHLDYRVGLPNWLTIILGIVIFIVLLYINFTLNFNLYNPLCTYQLEAKVIDKRPIFNGFDNTPSFEQYTYLYVIEYKYRNKKRKKSIMIMHDDITFEHSKVAIKINKLFPKMVHIMKKK